MTDGGPTLPSYVSDDLDANPGLVRRWVEDVEFRRGLLGSDDPAGFAANHDFQLQPQTATWIKQRVAARGLDRLVGDEYPHIVAF